VLRPLGALITTLPVGREHPGSRAGPSFELFYENDYLMPHREAAWLLLEERLRDAATFCGVLQGDCDPLTARPLAPIEDALANIADSLAAHQADWGGSSRFAAVAEARISAPESQSEPDHEEVVMSAAGEPVSFAANIQPLFREGDRESMKFAFDLWSHEDVTRNAKAILDRLEGGSMPCDGAWPAEKVDEFRRWVEGGMAA
jgi:hypothetical protein